MLYTGKNAGQQFSAPRSARSSTTRRTRSPCNPTAPPFDPRRCLRCAVAAAPASTTCWSTGSAATSTWPATGSRPGRRPVRRQRHRRPVRRAVAGASTGPRAPTTRTRSSSFVATSGILPPDEFPQFRQLAVVALGQARRAVRSAQRYQYVYSQIADVAYKRLTREIAVPAGGGNLTFWTSYDTEPDWDHLFVEARTAGGTTGRPCRTPTGTPPRTPGTAARRAGPSCTRTSTTTRRRDGDATCTPTGTTGVWHASSGNSGGWQQWSVDLTAYAGQTVEISIAYVSDWATQNLGVFIDDVTLPDGTHTSFEAGSTAGGHRARPRAAARTRTTGSVTDASGFPVGARSPPRLAAMGSGSRGSRRPRPARFMMERALDILRTT